MKHPCSFNHFLLDYSKKDQDAAYINIIIQPKINKTGEVSAEFEGKVFKLDEIYISSDFEQVFAGLFETIYQIRNLVVHGHIKPEKDEHEVVIHYILNCTA